MATVTEHETTNRPRGRARTACHTCHGSGEVWVPRAAVFSSPGLAGTASERRPCTAKGCQRGWLEGIHPPA